MRWTSIATATAPTRWATRRLLRAWARHGRAHGYFYLLSERCGGSVATEKPIAVRLPNGLVMHCDLRDHVQRAIYYQGVYEMIEAYLFTQLLAPGMVVVDAGANVGQYSLLASTAVGPTGAVHAFEPVPKNHSRTQAHLDANGVTNVQLNRAGLWDSPGTIELGLAADMLENAGSYSVGVKENTAVAAVTAPAVRFDDYAAEQGVSRVDLVKMDIEGSELAALRGMRATLERDRPPLLLEVNRHNCQTTGYEVKDLWQLLVDTLGYTAWGIGTSAEKWKVVSDPDAIVQENCLFLHGPLPESVARVWTYRGVIRWAATQQPSLRGSAA